MKKMVCILISLLLAGVASAEMVAHYTFDEGSGTTVYDTSGFGTAADGTIVSYEGKDLAYEYVADQFGGTALKLNGWTYVNCGYDADKWDFSSNAISITAWIKADKAQMNRWGFIAGQGDDSQSWRLSYHSGSYGDGWGDLMMWHPSSNDYEFKSEWVPEYPNPVDNEWHFIAATYDKALNPGTLRLWVDDFSAGYDRDGAPSMVDNLLDICLGTNIWQVTSNPGEDCTWIGALDDIRIFNHSLSAEEVASIIPEPATMSLLVLGGLTLLRRRR